MLYLQKNLTNFLKFFLAERRGTWLLWFKISSAQIFLFCNSNVTTFSTSRKSKNSIFPFTQSRQECSISERILRIFINFFSPERRGRCLLWCKISNAQIFWFNNSNVTTFPTSRKCKNFNFSLYTVPAEMQNLRKYLTNFLKVSLAERRGTWLLSLKISSAQMFSFGNSNVTTFPTSRKCKNFNFSLYTVPAEKLYLKKYLTNFEKLFFRWKKMKVAIVVKNFKYTDTLVLKWQRYNSSNIQKMLKFQFFPLHCPSRNAISPEVLNEISKTFFCWKRMRVAIVVQNFKCTDILVFQ